jgi:phosphoglycerol transferase
MNLSFTESHWPGVVDNVRGLAPAEQWGTWSVADVVALRFARPLPEKVKLTMTAIAFGPNAGKAMVARVGTGSADFTLGNHPEKRVLHVDNPSRSDLLTIHIPHPVSPKDLGLNADERPLGIGLIEMSISSD